jgi:TPR repeat protein
MQLCFEDISNEGHIPAFYDRDPLVQRDFLKKAAEDGHITAMYKFALECDTLVEAKHWLGRAAHKGYVPAMYALGLLCDRPGERRRWLIKAAESGHMGAIHTLAIDRHEMGSKDFCVNHNKSCTSCGQGDSPIFADTNIGTVHYETKEHSPASKPR